MKAKLCGDRVLVGRTDPKPVVCALEETHEGFHRGDGWVWDHRLGWREGEEPDESHLKRRRKA